MRARVFLRCAPCDCRLVRTPRGLACPQCGDRLHRPDDLTPIQSVENEPEPEDDQ